MKYFLTFALTILISAPAYAADTVNIKVLGMVCDFCAQSVLKVFYEDEGVENVDVSLDDGLVTVTLKDGATISDEQVTKYIEYGGYEVENIERSASE